MNDHVIPWTPSSDNFDELWENDPNLPNSIPDILTTMFAQQQKHIEAYDDIQGTVTITAATHGLENREVQARIREFAGYTVEELYEAINHLKNKPWKQTDRPVDEDKFRDEIGDMWHFLIEMCIIAGMGAEDVFQAYFQASLKNQRRQVSGY